MNDPDVERQLVLQHRAGARCALASVKSEIDRMSGNEIYRRAWKKVSIRVGQMLDNLESVNTTP